MISNLTTTSCALGGSDSASERQRLATILDEYLLEIERGAPVEPDDLLARHPDMADRLRGYLSGLALFHKAAAAGSSPLMSLTGEPGLGETLGDFRLLREIGRGGMGVVYEALQVSLDRRVAVKVLPSSPAISARQIMRFQHEAQAAAHIDHPHIVPVFAVGEERGTHYFAMQLISGQSLAELIIAQRDAGAPLAAQTGEHVQAVARVGVQAAEALHAAHEIGVVHRDVKPSNLLLDEKGKVWVTDFGVARFERGASLTEPGYVVGSMPYMSPEQAHGQAALVDQRTDVYSLGVSLYELATLRHPSEAPAQAETAIEVNRAQWLRPRTWNSAIPVDFENIVLKALAENRDDRYATARDLAEDLQRFLDGQPILARPPSLAQRIEKWARRHQKTMAAAIGTLALAMLGLVVSLVIIAIERNQTATALRAATFSRQAAERDRARAEKKFQQAHEVLDRFGIRVNQLLANQFPGAEGVRRELLAEMLPYYRDFARETAHDPDLQTDLALTYSKIGHLSEQLGDLAGAEQAYRDAQLILQPLANAPAGSAEQRRQLAVCTNNLGQALLKSGEVELARGELEQALALQQVLAKDSSLAPSVRPELAATLGNLALLSSQQGDKQRAAEHYQAAIDIQESLRAAAPRDPANRAQLAASYNNLSALSMPGQPAQSRPWVERALSLQLELVREFPTRRDYQCDLATSFNNLGSIHSKLKNWADAELCLRDAITIQRRLALAAPLVTSYQRDWAGSLNNLGLVQLSAARLAESEASLREALAIQQDLALSIPKDWSLHSGLGGIHNNLGMLQRQTDQLEAASESFERAIAAQRVAFEGAPGVARFREALSKHYYNQAVVLRALNKPADAAKAIVARRELWPNDESRQQRIAQELADVCRELPPGDERERYSRQAAIVLKRAGQQPSARQSAAQTEIFDVRFSEPIEPIAVP
jgi:serine/threonine protein kinase/tetratricopeptide (TPR) repeat protein